jgi:hypothetical protein
MTILNRPLKMMLFGDPGTGKTTIAASAHLIEEMKPVLFIDVDGGTVSLFRDRYDGAYDDLDIRDIRSRVSDSDSVLARLEALFDEAQTDNHKTIVLDTLSELNRIGMHYISEQNLGFKAVRDPKRITIPMYGASLQQTATLVRMFCALDHLGANVIMTANVRRKSDETSGEEVVAPGVIGQQWREVVAAFDEVFYLYTKAAVSVSDPMKGVQYKAITQPYESLKTKNRYLEVPVMLDLTGKTLEDILRWQN